MKIYPPEADEDYEGNKGCLIMVVAALTTFGAIAISILVGYAINKLINLIS